MKSTDFYRIEATVYTRWFLGSPLDPDGKQVDPRLFTQGKRVEGLPPLSLPVAQAGDVVDFNLAAFDMPIARRTFNEALEELVGNSIQRIPISVEGDSLTWEILNVCKTALCIDEKRTKYVTKWKNEDHRKDKLGEYRMLSGLKIDPLLVSDSEIFRLEGWNIAMICSERVKKLADNSELSGICFEIVS